MLKKNKWKIVISSLVVLLPILFGLILWNKLPDVMTTHFGADGVADGFSGKAFAVFGLPLILLAAHFVCLLFTLLDKRQAEQNAKALRMVFWIIPALSILANGLLYRAALGKETDMWLIAPLLLGVVFLLIGNYLPKVRQNAALGIKIAWTLRNEENWNRTHRFAGKVWVAGGLLLLVSVFLPIKAATWVLPPVIAAVALLPILYSYRLFQKHQKQGIVYASLSKSKAGKRLGGISAALAVVILIAVAVLMCTGDFEVACGESSVQIHAAYWTDAAVDYSQIDDVSYREGLDVGVRTNGLGTARLSLGIFQNEEFGSYTLYAYTNAEGFVVLTSDDQTLVIGMREAKDVQTIYDAISAKMAE